MLGPHPKEGQGTTINGLPPPATAYDSSYEPPTPPRSAPLTPSANSLIDGHIRSPPRLPRPTRPPPPPPPRGARQPPPPPRPAQREFLDQRTDPVAAASFASRRPAPPARRPDMRNVCIHDPGRHDRWKGSVAITTSP